MSEQIPSEGLEGAGQQEAPEKMLTQSEVNSLVGRTRTETAERTRNKLEQEFEQRMQELESSKASHPESTGEINEERMIQQLQERMNQESQQLKFETEMKRIADSYNGKIKQGHSDERYDDYEKVMSDFEPESFPQLVYLVADMDNAADIMYELSKNPTKLATIDYLAIHAPKKAKSELANIGNSISANQQGIAEADEQSTMSPLDRLKPSRISGSDGNLSIKDLRAQSWLRR